MSSLLIVGEGDVLCGNTVWQEKQKERKRRPRIVFGRPTTLTCKHINLHLYYLLAYDLSQIRDTTLKFFQDIEKLSVFLCLFLGTDYKHLCYVHTFLCDFSPKKQVTFSPREKISVT